MPEPKAAANRKRLAELLRLLPALRKSIEDPSTPEPERNALLKKERAVLVEAVGKAKSG